MSTKISNKNPYNKPYELFKESRINAAAKAADDIYKDQPYSEEYYPVYLASNGLKLVANIISALTCYFALYYALEPTLGTYAAIPSAVVVCLILELLKNALWRLTSKQRIKYNLLNYTLLIALVALHIFSVGGSAYGAARLADSIPIATIPSPAYHDVDSLNKAYVAAIKSLDQQIKALSTCTRSKCIAATANLIKQKQELTRTNTAESTRLTALNQSLRLEHQANSQTATKEREKALQRYKTTAVVAAISFELLFIICQLFSMYYLFRCYVDTNSEQTETPPTVQVELPVIDSDPKQEQPSQAPEAIKRTEIKGFSNGAQEQELEKLQFTRICEYGKCAKPYLHKVANQKFCSSKCRLAAHLEKKTAIIT